MRYFCSINECKALVNNELDNHSCGLTVLWNQKQLQLDGLYCICGCGLTVLWNQKQHNPKYAYKHPRCGLTVLWNQKQPGRTSRNTR